MKQTSNSFLYILIYVDDIIVLENSSDMVQSLITKLNNSFSLNDLGTLNYFLDVSSYSHRSGELFLSQVKYIFELLNKANFLEVSPIPIPMISSPLLSTRGGVSSLKIHNFIDKSWVIYNMLP